MSHPSVLYELVIDLGTQQWGVACTFDQTLTGPVQYGWDRFQKDPQSMTFGGGLLAGSPLPGTRRMIFCGYSPCWEGFYVSSLGGAMHIFHRIGVNYVWLKGTSKEETVIVIKHYNGLYDLSFQKIETNDIWANCLDDGNINTIGFYALQNALFEKYKDIFPDDRFRILTVGPASKYTREGAIGSSDIKKGALSPVDDWAGRGGFGSRLLQYHKVAGIIFGGDWEDPGLNAAKELDKYFFDHFGQGAIKSDIALSMKYRYVPEFETGGTFGVNMQNADDRLFSFNYRSIYANNNQRLEQHKNFILNHYLRQFNDEIIKPRNFSHCGEPCPIVCKKIFQNYKKDYEPYQVFGPNCGIFDQRAAERVNKYIDAMGWDSIQAGGTVSWIMELIAYRHIPPGDFNLPARGPDFTFSYQDTDFDIEKSSKINADYAIRIIQMFLFHPEGNIFQRGMRYAAKYLDNKYNIRSIDFAVYNAHGKEGYMVPNQYWVPGMFSPMPMMGKYFTFYGVEYLSPRDLGRKNVERMIYELYSENSGSCRFHRKWVEDIIDEIILAHFDLHFDYWQTNFELARAIHNFQSSNSVFWESERVVDIIQKYLEKWSQDGLHDNDLDKWIKKFKQDKWQAAREYWNDLFDGMNTAFHEGMVEPHHQEHQNIK